MKQETEQEREWQEGGRKRRKVNGKKSEKGEEKLIEKGAPERGWKSEKREQREETEGEARN